MDDEVRTGAFSAPKNHATADFTSRSMNTSNMSPASPVSTMHSPAKAMHAKLHKRGGSGSGSAVQPTTSTPFNNATEPFPSIATPVQASPRAKVKPYLRKLSSTQDDQGRIDLSKSLADNEKVAGLGIQDFASRPSTERKPTHTRTTSVGSQMSTGSGSYRPQPFIHPMRQAPRPYTPSRSTAVQDEEDDIVEDDYRPSYAFRPRRSMSNSSAQAPTPLSQTITAADLGSIPRLTSVSQSNLSIVSTKSSMPNGSRRNTGRSTELGTSPSSRTSFDRTFGPRRSDTSTQTRDERIQVARRKFQEKEAGKDRKAEKEAIRRREAEEAKEHRRQQRERGRSDASEKARPARPGMAGRTGSALGMVSSLAYEPTTAGAAMPAQSEKQTRHTQSVDSERNTGFLIRLLSCGGRK